MSEDTTLGLEITAAGPATTGGRLPLSELARIAGEFQSTLERIALGRTGESPQSGRRRKAVVEAVRLEIRGFRPGSAILTVERAAHDALFGHELLAQSLDDLHVGTDAIINGNPDALPASFSMPVLDGLLRMCGGIADSSVATVDFRVKGQSLLHIDQAFRDAVRSMRTSRHYDEATIVGRLQMGDFAPSTLRCRIDTLDASIVCDFDESLRDEVLAAMDSMVIATGRAEYGIDRETIRVLVLVELTVVAESSRKSFAELASEQGIAPVTDLSDFFPNESVEDDDFERFLNAAMSARGE
ncbi:hypothetical protein [Modestobacter sp. VKM Ac-2984]|uniref:hypothetical protein n=1 Tax=Modestobacter sp. VKM Ac-2984 TaxID=3004138 RepID=UPI0022AAD8EE|nr:hypothetical protein [Modestobacter sp. VKM Ac-2984]MCZ2815225.1 hypothetical protein [Modestobacter sp. VKM Ac-2984]